MITTENEVNDHRLKSRDRTIHHSQLIIIIETVACFS